VSTSPASGLTLWQEPHVATSERAEVGVPGGLVPRCSAPAGHQSGGHLALMGRAERGDDRDRAADVAFQAHGLLAGDAAHGLETLRLDALGVEARLHVGVLLHAPVGVHHPEIGDVLAERVGGEVLHLVLGVLVLPDTVIGEGLRGVAGLAVNRLCLFRERCSAVRSLI
jgi:hypothetical protein